MSDLQLVALLKVMGAFDPHRGAIYKSAVGRDIVQIIIAVFIPDFDMATGHKAVRIRQGPIHAGIAADFEAALVSAEFNGTAIFKMGLIVDAKAQAHFVSTVLSAALGWGRAGTVQLGVRAPRHSR
jgi:hypothetical protein